MVHRGKEMVFSPVLQQGVQVPVRLGDSLKSILRDQVGISGAYLSGRVKTIFLNGKPVDDPASAMVRDKAVIALSAAMPGLVGATFRSNSPLSVFRSGITHRPEHRPPRDGSAMGSVTLKFFNLVASEAGPGVLARGVWVDAGAMKNFIEETGANWQTVFKTIEKDGIPIKPDELPRIQWGEGGNRVHLTVQAGM